MLRANIQPTKQILPIDLVAPGSYGLNTVESGMLIDPKYAVNAYNAVIDINGRLASRNGQTQFCSAQIQNGPVQSLFEWKSTPTTYNQVGVVSNAANSAWSPINNWQTETAAGAGTQVPATARYYLQNFNNKVIGFAPGQVPLVYTGTWNNVVASQGVAPTTNGVGTVAFGRVWAVQTDGQTIQYSGILDETDWGSPLSGTIDMHTVWTDGTDTVTAIFQFNAALVICGLKHIVFYTDGRGSLLGMDPTQAYVFDVVTGTGVVSQWTVDFIGQTDVVFLSTNGVQSLSRITAERSNPIQTLTKKVRDQLLAQMQNETSTGGVLTFVSGAYNPQQGFYLLCLPNSKAVYCCDMRRKYMDESNELLSRITTWTTPLAIWSIVTDHTSTTFLGMDKGIIATYSSSSVSDVTGPGTTSSFIYAWLSPWMNFAQQGGEQVAVRIKLLKQYNAIVNASGNSSITLTWNTDFATVPSSAVVSLGGGGGPSQYGINQYGSNSVPLSQYGLTSALGSTGYDARARGQYFQLGMNITITSAFSLQQIQLNCKIGRVAGPLIL